MRLEPPSDPANILPIRAAATRAGGTASNWSGAWTPLGSAKPSWT